MSRNIIEITTEIWFSNRERTLATLDKIAESADAAAILGWRPGDGRAHIAWQLMHIGVTEELFATERILGTPPGYGDLIGRYRGGSKPDDNIPTVNEIRTLLSETRQHLMTTLGDFIDSDLGMVPEPFKERGWSLGKILQILAWHEPHHQGQAHITLNLRNAQQA